MPTPEDIAQQQDLLAIHRRTLAQLCRQAAQYGGETAAQPAIINGLHEVRANIKRVKCGLRKWGVEVEDYPDDEAPPVPPPEDYPDDRAPLVREPSVPLGLSTTV
jgi:hypothetical protein